jgi:hypothetical protein
MPTERHPVSRHLRRHLGVWQEASLRWGEASHRPQGFASDDARRAAWFRHRDWLLARCARYGWRPAGFWDYECSVERPRDPCFDRAILWAAGLLSREERRGLEAGWRKDFEEAQEPDFTIVIAPGEILRGQAAQTEHFRNAGIPRQLLSRWVQARRRRARIIGQLETAPAPAQ